MNNNRKSVDALNVFPVPDGDTGTNMSMTISAAAREVSACKDDASVGEVAAVCASALLRGARGNSGVILSLIFRGFASSLKGCNEATGPVIAAALSLGVEYAYKAVMKPTEGTILTVVRCAAEAASKASLPEVSACEVWSAACSGAQTALNETPSMLPILKKAGVVDAGGQGLVFILEGMRSVFCDGVTVASIGASAAQSEDKEEKPPAAGDVKQDIKFAYCSEYIVNRRRSCTLPPEKLKAYLQSVGDCVVVVDDEEIIKVHAHSNEPGNVIQAGLQYGELVNIKIENMREQHGNASWGAVASDGGAQTQSAEYENAEQINEYGFVAVAAGAGIEEIFREVGVDSIVSGGQTMNPSTDDILNAVMATPAKHVFVLPNNKNIIMAAEQAAPLADRKVSVLPTKTVSQGITAALSFDPELDAEANLVNMMHAAEKVSCVQVTFAARDSSVNGQNIKEGQILGMENGKITVVENNIVTAAYKATKHLAKRDTSMITVFYGEDSSEQQAEELCSMLRGKFSDAEVSAVNGGQPVYYFIVSIE